jgi:hypothetical protein
VREWLWWLQDAQHEWWFVPGGLGCLALIIAVFFVGRIAYGRIAGRLMSPRMKGTDDQVESQWATAADLERFGLVERKKGFWKWIAR